MHLKTNAQVKGCVQGKKLCTEYGHESLRIYLDLHLTTY